MKALIRRIWRALPVTLLVGCGANDDMSGATGATGQGPDAGVPPLDDIRWTPCPFYTGGTSEDAACGTVDVPFNWDDPGGARVTLFVKRVGSPTGVQAVWFLMGGPGGASNGYEPLAEQVLGADPNLTIYLHDHRGTGRSTRLGCPAEEAVASDQGWLITEAEWPACAASLQAQWGEHLSSFSTTMAARDLGWLIDATRLPGQGVHIHGGSYGTFWAQRYLQIFPDQPTSVSLIGVVHPAFSFTKYDEGYEVAGKKYLDACSGDAFCATKLGPDAEATFRTVMSDIGGYCPAALAAGLSRDALRQFFAGMLLFGWYERVLPLAIMYRIKRCASGDVTALQSFAANMKNPLDDLKNDPLFSTPLSVHIGLSDLWEPPIPTLAEAQKYIDNALWAPGGTARLTLDPIWPKYPEDQYADGFADTAVPMLMMNGEYDPASPLSQALPVGAHLAGANQHFAALPGAAHSFTTPTTKGYGCAVNMFFEFMEAPTAALFDCTSIILPLDFHGTSDVASLFGAADLWENSPAKVDVDPRALTRVRGMFARYLTRER